MKTNILFPAQIEYDEWKQNSSRRNIDQFWEAEAAIAQNLFDISKLAGTHFAEPIKIINQDADRFLYRGWILRPQSYKEISDLNFKLYNSYDDYLWSFEFPRWYEFLQDDTPKSFIILGDEIADSGIADVAKKISSHFGSSPIMIKDFLKSRKHEWFDACFIRDTSDTEEVIRVVSNFFKLQGRDFYGGLVCREFLSLKQLGIHPKSRMPLPIEFRTFFLNQVPFYTVPYWDNDVPYNDLPGPPLDWLKYIGNKLQTPFAALDIAQDENNKWHVIEVNDGGSAGLPERANLTEFYRQLHNNL